MIKQIFKMIWNRKRRNLLLIIEVLVSCIIIFITSCILTDFLRNYFLPLGYDYKNLIYVNCYWADSLGTEEQAINTVRERYKAIRSEMEGFNEVEAVSMTSSAIPYSYSESRTMIEYKHIKRNPYFFMADDNFLKVNKLTLLEGRWFNKTDDAAAIKTAVINADMRTRMFKGEDPINKIVKTGLGDRRIIGVITDYRYLGEFHEENDNFFFRNTLDEKDASLTGYFIIRLKPGSSVMVEDKILKRIYDLYPNSNVNIERIEDMRYGYLKLRIFRMIFFSTVGLFLILNAALGLFGILWYNINKRRPEIGIRRAVGAGKNMIYFQILGEVIVITSFSVVMGIIIETQISMFDAFKLETFIYIAGVMISIIMIYFLTSLCAVYPSFLASRIEPAAALHDE